MSDIIQTSEREPEQQVQEPKRNTHKPLWIVLAVVFLAASCEFYWYDRMMR